MPNEIQKRINKKANPESKSTGSVEDTFENRIKKKTTGEVLDELSNIEYESPSKPIELSLKEFKAAQKKSEKSINNDKVGIDASLEDMINAANPANPEGIDKPGEDLKYPSMAGHTPFNFKREKFGKELKEGLKAEATNYEAALGKLDDKEAASKDRLVMKSLLKGLIDAAALMYLAKNAPTAEYTNVTDPEEFGRDMDRLNNHIQNQQTAIREKFRDLQNKVKDQYRMDTTEEQQRFQDERSLYEDKIRQDRQRFEDQVGKFRSDVDKDRFEKGISQKVLDREARKAEQAADIASRERIESDKLSSKALLEREKLAGKKDRLTMKLDDAGLGRELKQELADQATLTELKIHADKMEDSAAKRQLQQDIATMQDSTRFAAIKQKAASAGLDRELTEKIHEARESGKLAALESKEGIADLDRISREKIAGIRSRNKQFQDRLVRNPSFADKIGKREDALSKERRKQIADKTKENQSKFVNILKNQESVPASSVKTMLRDMGATQAEINRIIKGEDDRWFSSGDIEEVMNRIPPNFSETLSRRFVSGLHGESSAPETKIVGGKTYQKVPNGWKLVE
jgi:hypothetical protein